MHGRSLRHSAFVQRSVGLGLVQQPLDSGDIVVTDAQLLPTSKDQCKDGGWQTYGAFKDQGDCVSFVATGGKNPPSGAKP
jgi:hypothetical protein